VIIVLVSSAEDIKGRMFPSASLFLSLTASEITEKVMNGF